MEMVHIAPLRSDLALAIAKLERVQKILNEEDLMPAPSLMAANKFIKEAAVLMFDVSLPLESAMERITEADMEEYAATLKPTDNNEEDDIDEQPEGQFYIVTLHYLKLLSDRPRMYNCTKQTVPPVDLEESHGGENAFPKHCTYCGRDELRFSRVEEHSKPDSDGHTEILKAYKIHHVVCPNCGTEGPLEDFQ